VRIIRVFIGVNQVPLFWMCAWELSVYNQPCISSAPMIIMIQGFKFQPYLQHLSTVDAAESATASGSSIALSSARVASGGFKGLLFPGG